MVVPGRREGGRVGGRAGGRGGVVEVDLLPEVEEVVREVCEFQLLFRAGKEGGEKGEKVHQ